MARLKLHSKSKEDEYGAPSIIGTIAGDRRFGDDDSEEDGVYWKFKMDDKYVDTSGLVINQYEDKVLVH